MRRISSDLRALARRVRHKAASVRPIPQFRTLRRYDASPFDHLGYLAVGRELTNFTYDITNRDEMAFVLADVLGADVGALRSYVAELDDDDDLASRLAARIGQRPLYGRRLGWYAVVRHTKPQFVVETGTADGLGTAVLARGLQRNGGGAVLTVDVLAGAGHLLDHDLRQSVRLERVDEQKPLETLLTDERVDLFLHDSLHTPEHERWELTCALRHAGDRIVLMSDNSHLTDVLAEIAGEQGMSYAFWREQPSRHFYPGAGIGIAVAT
jgi:hypothetical protein